MDFFLHYKTDLFGNTIFFNKINMDYIIIKHSIYKHKIIIVVVTFELCNIAINFNTLIY